jgi:hypothetical protein
MSDIIKPNPGILFMKVGVHAQEDLDSIIRRKIKEIEDTGYALWGYGGGTCHPTKAVQPFAQEYVAKGQPVYLWMHEMVSKHHADQVRAEQMSVDGMNYEPIPQTINVLGSRYALAIKDLRREEFPLLLSRVEVAIGNSRGKSGQKYIAGRVDKACFNLCNDVLTPPEPESTPIQINLVAELCPPYAVFLKN